MTARIRGKRTSTLLPDPSHTFTVKSCTVFPAKASADTLEPMTRTGALAETVPTEGTFFPEIDWMPTKDRATEGLIVAERERSEADAKFTAAIQMWKC